MSTARRSTARSSTPSCLLLRTVAVVLLWSTIVTETSVSAEVAAATAAQQDDLRPDLEATRNLLQMKVVTLDVAALRKLSDLDALQTRGRGIEDICGDVDALDSEMATVDKWVVDVAVPPPPADQHQDQQQSDNNIDTTTIRLVLTNVPICIPQSCLHPYQHQGFQSLLLEKEICALSLLLGNRRQPRDRPPFFTCEATFQPTLSSPLSPLVALGMTAEQQRERKTKAIETTTCEEDVQDVETGFEYTAWWHYLLGSSKIINQYCVKEENAAASSSCTCSYYYEQILTSSLREK
jgi:hypothetical protein